MPEPIKKDIFKEFQEHSIAEFFKKNRQMLGYSGKIRSLTTAIHEYLTNSMDACEESKILPELFVQVERLGPEHFKVVCEDNGPGIPKKIVAKAFGKMLAGTKFHRFQQARGQQGIGGSGVVMFGQITTGKPTKIVSSRGDGTIYECLLSIDVSKNEANIQEEKEYPGHMRGTRVETELKDILYQKGEYSVDEYVRRTALANPHCKITYIDPEGQTIVYDRSVDAVPSVPKPAQPHPKGITVDDLLSFAATTNARTIKSFLTTEFTRMSAQKAGEIEKQVKFDMNKRPQDMAWDEAEQIINSIKKMDFIAPPTDCLIPISEKYLEKALQKILEPEFCIVLTRPPTVFRGGVPFVVEVGLAYGGKAGKHNTGGKEGEQQELMEVMRFANRVPILFDAGGCAITKAVQAIEWKRYDIKADVPVTVFINFSSVYVPYTGAGKQAVSEEEEIIKEIRLALMDAGRALGKFVSGQRRQYEREAKKKMLLRYVEPIAEAFSKLTGKPQKLIEKKLVDLIETKFGEYVGEETEEPVAVAASGKEDNEE